MSNRGEWKTRTGFILAAIGSAVGLGNIWRFPYVVASNGGGAFMIVYLIALLTAGVPIVILEFSIGHKMHKGAPGSFKVLNPKWELLGWFQVFTSFAIIVYYTAIVGWSFGYAFNSLNGLAWGNDTKGFFFETFLKLTDGPFNLGGLNMNVFIPLVIVWVLVYVVLVSGVESGIEKANKTLMPLLFIMILIILVRGLTLPGALAGIDFMFKPDFSKIANPNVWVAAYGQVFFSLSVAFAIMITYSSYLPEKSDIVNNGFITSFADCSFSLLAGLSVFSMLGYMANNMGVSVSEVSTAGPGLAFVVFPQAINALPGFNKIFGAIFFLSLSFAGFTSTISIAEVIIAAIVDKYNITRTKAVTFVVLIAGIVSIAFATGAGLYILDIVDYFVNNYNIVLGGLMEIVLVGWIYKLTSLKEHANAISDFKLGGWWDFCLKILTPIMLIIMLVLKFLNDIKVPYENYPQKALIILGWSMPILGLLCGIIFLKISSSKKDY